MVALVVTATGATTRTVFAAAIDTGIAVAATHLEDKVLAVVDPSSQPFLRQHQKKKKKGAGLHPRKLNVVFFNHMMINLCLALGFLNCANVNFLCKT